ncbi:MAG: hypothetical protein OEV66_02495 [Spirochaetia bacterium]|nr:hypothetical protein [Spirochaetia bacterium]
MNKILAKIDAIIEKIPVHIRDIIQKGFLAVVAMIALVAILLGVKRGIENATPGGVQLFEKTANLFYIDKIREENKKKNRLIEDVDVYKELFESRDERIHPTFRKLGRDTDDRLIGESQEFIKKPDPLKRKDGEFLFENENNPDGQVLPDRIKKSNEAGKTGNNNENETIPLLDDKADNKKPGAEQPDFEKVEKPAPQKSEEKKSSFGIHLID